jgi:NAD(P)H-dependent flavin oxidoreductase YrpB (nitropropane dioxygenase family)
MTLPLFAFTRSPDVVIAVSRAGGMGVQAAIGFSPEELDAALSKITRALEGRPFGVDVVMPAGFVRPDGSYASQGDAMPDAETYRKQLPERHVRFVDELLARYGVPPLPEGATAEVALREWSSGVSERQVDIALQYPIRLIANALGPPPKPVIERCHQKGVKVAALVGAKEHALKQVAQGVDIIVAQGTEAGGHCGEIATMVLVPEVVRAVSPTPVVAAGGIGTGQQILAALALGAQAAWTGSIWLTTEEGQIDAAVSRKLVAAGSGDTVRSRAISGKPARQLKSTWSDAWADPETPDPLPMPLHFLLIAEAQARVHRYARETGKDDLITSPVGQIVGTMNAVRPAAEVVQQLSDELAQAHAALAGLGLSPRTS